MAIAQRQRTAFPFGVRIHRGITGADGFAQAVKAFGVTAPPTFGAFEGSRLVKSNDVAGRGLCGGRAGAHEQGKRQHMAKEVHGRSGG